MKRIRPEASLHSQSHLLGVLMTVVTTNPLNHISVGLWSFLPPDCLWEEPHYSLLWGYSRGWACQSNSALACVVRNRQTDLRGILSFFTIRASFRNGTALSFPASLGRYHPHLPENFTSDLPVHLQGVGLEYGSLLLTQSWASMFFDSVLKILVGFSKKRRHHPRPVKAVFVSPKSLSWLIRQRELPTWHSAPRELLLSVCTHSTLTKTHPHSMMRNSESEILKF